MTSAVTPDVYPARADDVNHLHPLVRLYCWPAPFVRSPVQLLIGIEQRERPMGIRATLNRFNLLIRHRPSLIPVLVGAVPMAFLTFLLLRIPPLGARSSEWVESVVENFSAPYVMHRRADALFAQVEAASSAGPSARRLPPAPPDRWRTSACEPIDSLRGHMALSRSRAHAPRCPAALLLERGPWPRAGRCPERKCRQSSEGRIRMCQLCVRRTFAERHRTDRPIRIGRHSTKSRTIPRATVQWCIRAARPGSGAEGAPRAGCDRKPPGSPRTAACVCRRPPHGRAPRMRSCTAARVVVHQAERGDVRPKV